MSLETRGFERMREKKKGEKHESEQEKERGGKL